MSDNHGTDARMQSEDLSFEEIVRESAHAGGRLGHEGGGAIGGLVAEHLHMGETTGEAAGHAIGEPLGTAAGAVVGIGAGLLHEAIRTGEGIYDAVSEYATEHGGGEHGGTLPPGGVPADTSDVGVDPR